MSSNIQPGTYKIVSLEGDRATSFKKLGHSVPTYYVVRLGEPVDTWKIEKVHDNDYYRLTGLGGYPSTGINDQDKVIVSVQPPVDRWWRLIHVKHQHAFLIALAEAPEYGWSVSNENSTNPEIVIRKLIGISTDHVTYPNALLFKFERIDN